VFRLCGRVLHSGSLDASKEDGSLPGKAFVTSALPVVHSSLLYSPFGR